MASANSATQHQLEHLIPRTSTVSEMVDNIDDRFIRKPKQKPAYVTNLKRNSRSFNDAYQVSSNQYQYQYQYQHQQQQQLQQQQQQQQQQQPQQQSHHHQNQYPQQFNGYPQQYNGYQQQQQKQQQQQQQYPPQQQQYYPQKSQRRKMDTRQNSSSKSQYMQQQQYGQQQFQQKPYSHRQQQRSYYQQQQKQQQQQPQVPYQTQPQRPHPYQPQQYQQQKYQQQQNSYLQQQRSYPQYQVQKQPSYPQQQKSYPPNSSAFYSNPQAPSTTLHVSAQQQSSSTLHIPQRSANRQYSQLPNRSPNRSPVGNTANIYASNSNSNANLKESHSQVSINASQSQSQSSNVIPANNINNYTRTQTPGKSSPSTTTTTTTSDSSTSISRTPVKQSSSNSKNINIVSPLTDISSAEDLDSSVIPLQAQFQGMELNLKQKEHQKPQMIQQIENSFESHPIDTTEQQQQQQQQHSAYPNHPVLPQQKREQHIKNTQKSEYNSAALAARAAVKNPGVSRVQTIKKSTVPVVTPTQLKSSASTTGSSSSSAKPTFETKKGGFFKKIFSRSKSTKQLSTPPSTASTEKSSLPSTLPAAQRRPESTDSKKESRFSLRRLSLIRTSSRSSNVSRSSSIDLVRIGEPKVLNKKGNNSVRSSLNNSSKTSLHNSITKPTIEASENISTPKLDNITNSGMRIFTPVNETVETNSSFNTLSNTDLPASNLTISNSKLSPFNSTDSNGMYDYLNDLKSHVGVTSESAKHSLVGIKSDNNSFYSANEQTINSPNPNLNYISNSTFNSNATTNENASNRIIKEKTSNNQLKKISTTATQESQTTQGTTHTTHTDISNISELSHSLDVDHSLLSISKIDSKVLNNVGHDREVVELGYLSTVAGLGETSFFNSALSKSNTNKSGKSVNDNESSNVSTTTEVDNDGVLKLGLPSKTIKRKPSWNSLKAKEEKKGLITKLGRKIPFVKLREKFDFSFDEYDDESSDEDYKNKNILDDDLKDDSYSNKDEEENHGLNYDNEFFQGLKNKHVLPSNYEPKHKEIGTLKSCIKDEDDYEHLLHGKNIDVDFVDDVTYGVTFGNDTYDRYNPDMKKVYVMMTYYPREIRAIRIELNEFKKNEMIVNEESRQFTHTFAV
ncbi:kinase-regulated stress-responsive transcription factor skn7 [Pichia californica]|uniref:Kinase-regulated stress-responsive transcription factor skn7 n=1 Tax=Pichia californica TaxID=460514 RepID=A0A9P6WHI2_9ASCO|nr:kinase-regulated stress-responsive transcription factor skn7 [[Candida] californica]